MKNKIIISESEKFKIKKMYGLLNEQVQLPQIIKGTFTSNDADSAHNLLKMEKQIDDILPKIYAMGVNPKMYDVSMSIKTIGNNNFTTSYSVRIDKSDDGKAWMGFSSRGSIGSGYEQRADGQMSGTENKDGLSLEEKLKTIGAIEVEEISNSPIVDKIIKLKQYFVQFTKQKYPPIEQSNNTTKDTDLGRHSIGSVVLEKDAFNKLSKKLQEFTKRVSDAGESLSVGDFKLFVEGDKIIIDIKNNPKGKKYSKLVLAINNEAKRAQESKGYVIIKSGKIQLPGEFASSKPEGYDWYLFGETEN
jgi:hypothetical protein